MVQSVTVETKDAFKASFIKKQYRIFIDWITKGDSPGTITAGEWSTTYFGKDNVGNGALYQSYQPLILSSSMRLSSNVRLLSNKYENGWLSSNRSNASGVFASAEIISNIFTSVIGATHLTVTTSPYNYLVNFDLYYRDETDTSWILCDSYTNLTDYITVYTFASETNIKGWKLEITKISKADMMASIIEVDVGFREDITEDLIDFEVRKELEYSSEKSISIGNISANSIELRMNNAHQKYNPKNADSPVYPYLKSNKAIRPYIGVDIDDTIVYIPQGIFYLRDIKPKADMMVEFYAIDRMLLFQEKAFDSSLLYEGKTISELAAILATDFGLGAPEYNIDATTETIPYAWFASQSYASGFKKLAIAEGGVATVDELGIFNFHKRNWGTSIIVETINDNLMVHNTAYSPFIAQNMKNYIKITSNPLYLQAEASIYSTSEVITLAPSETKTIICYYSTIPCKNVDDAVITADVDIAVVSEYKYAYATYLTVINNGAGDETITAISIDGQSLKATGANVVKAKDTNLINIYGTSEYVLDSELIQELVFAQNLADDLLTSYKDPDAELELDSLSLPYLQLGDLIAVRHDKLNIGKVLF